MKRKFTLLVLLLFIIRLGCQADEGMWIPMLLKKYNIEDMQKQGFKLTAEDIYDINQASLKDAVVGLGKADQPFWHNCTGELISREGLMVTNHHCAFDMIQKHTTLDNNYLKNGFWARNKKEELANPGITASVLVRMEDVTDKIKSQLTADMSETERNIRIEQLSKTIESEAVKGTNLQANIQPYFNGNQFFMCVFKIYKDVRLVGAPPSSIGKFGGDTDNWMWPRHTGDFAVLRIYADENNEPASFSEKNKPYQPASFFKVSTGGVKEGDFTFVFGYPARSNQYAPSFAVEQIVNIENPHKIAIRTAKLDIINRAMESDELLRIKYASKAASIANAWKKWQGETKGLKRFNTVENKRQLEIEFNQWAKTHPAYSGLVDRYKELYKKKETYSLPACYLTEAGLNGAEIINFAYKNYKLTEVFKTIGDPKVYPDSVINSVRNKITENLSAFFKDYDVATDQQMLAKLLQLFKENVEEDYTPAMILTASRKGKSFELLAEEIFRKSIFTNQQKLTDFVKKMNKDSYKKLASDPVLVLANELREIYSGIQEKLIAIQSELKGTDRLWVAGLMEMKPEKTFYPDANSTLRVSYGKVGGYKPCDGVTYKHYTTLDGIMEKDNPAIYDYDIPQKLRDVYKAKDFGPYTQDGQVPVCFIAGNHTSGGNSGSPILNANGHLLGLNFDRAWDGVMSDLQYDPDICRNISVDIRYVLFIIDKVAGAKHLIDEMVLVD